MNGWTREIWVALLGLFLAFVAGILAFGCYNTTKEPPCTNVMTCPDPTRPPPVVDLPKDPLAPPFTTFYDKKHPDGGPDR
jgi:hypothetical protein